MLSSLVLRACCLLAFVAAGTLASIATPPPPSPFLDTEWTPMSKAKPATNVTLGSFEVQFEITTLGDVRRKVGAGDISHQGDAAESIYWICYTASSERVWIIAHGEMGGDIHRITEMVAQRVQPAKATESCSALPQDLQPLSVSRRISLGLSEQKALHILGRPSYQSGPWRSFDFLGKVPGHCEPGGFDLSNFVQFKADRGRVVAIRAGQVTSC